MAFGVVPGRTDDREAVAHPMLHHGVEQREESTGGQAGREVRLRTRRSVRIERIPRPIARGGRDLIDIGTVMDQCQFVPARRPRGNRHDALGVRLHQWQKHLDAFGTLGMSAAGVVRFVAWVNHDARGVSHHA